MTTKQKNDGVQMTRGFGRIGRLVLLWAALAVAWPGAARAQDIDLGVAGDYAGFILGDARGLARVEGRLAVGRDLDGAWLEVGTDLARDDSDRPTLVVGRDVSDFRFGHIWANGGRQGHGLVGGSMSNVSPRHDLRRDEAPFDVEAETSWLTMMSAQLAALPPTGSARSLLFVLTLQGSRSDVEVFSLSAADVGLGKIARLTNIKPGATIVINVRADAQRQVRLLVNADSFHAHQQRVLFNFPDTDVLRLDGARIKGSILAPHACAQGVGGRIDGTLVAASLIGAVDIGHTPFIARK